MSQPVYRAAIIGTGRIGSTYDDEVVDRRPPEFFQGEFRHNGLYTVLPVNHAGAYRTTAGFELVAAANRSEAKLREFGRRWDVKALYTSVAELLRQERPDIVSVCTQSPEKAEITIAAAEAGVRAIIVEKAMATSLAEADAMLAACERHGVLLAVNHPNRFSPVNRRVRSLIETGAIGELSNVVAHSVGGMLHVGTHTFDLLRFWAGDIVEVWANVPNYQPEKDLPARGMLQFANGVTGFFDHCHGLSPSYEVRGKTGYLTASSLVGDGWLATLHPFSTSPQRPYPNRLTLEPIEAGRHDLSPTQRLLAELHQALTQATHFVSTGQDGAAALEVALACYASQVAGGPVRLPLAERSLRVPNR